MKKVLSMSCIDINTPFCPCLLAKTNDCVFCSHLRGESTCNCDWAGVCILYEQRWQSKKQSLTSQEEKHVRMETETTFNIVNQLAPDIYVIEFEVPEELVEAVDKVGAFVFIRNAHDPEFFHFPVGVMQVKGKKIKVVIEAIGPKSSSLFLNKNHNIWVRGPYFNGVLGQPWIEHATCGKILLVAGGMGQPPALPIAAKLVKNNNNVTALLAPGKVGQIFIKEDLQVLGVKVCEVDSMRRAGMEYLEDWFANRDTRPDLVVSAGPDEQHYGIINVMHEINVNIPMAATNNARMCCGEGICGSCEKELNNGQKVRICKIQTDFSNLKSD